MLSPSLISPAVSDDAELPPESAPDAPDSVPPAAEEVPADEPAFPESDEPADDPPQPAIPSTIDAATKIAAAAFAPFLLISFFLLNE